MIKQIIKYALLTIIINFVCFSCSKPIDFNQINDFEVSPVIESSLIFLDEPANRFLDNGNQISTVQDFILVEFFNSKFIVDNLVKAEFVFETTNSINRAFQVRVDFLDDLDQTQHSFTFLTTPSSDNSSVISNYTEVFEDNTLMALKATKKLVFTLNLLPGVPINQNTIGRISLKSKAIFYFNIDKSI